MKDPGEEGLPQWLINFSGPLNNNFGKLTGLDGMNHETDLPVGEYGLNLFMKQGWLATTPTNLSTFVATGSTAYVEFGVVFGGVIGDLIWYDDDQDGVADPGEEGIEGVTVRLYQDTDDNGSYETFIETLETDVDGGYLFDGLPAGDYLVSVLEDTLPSGDYWLTTPPEPLAMTLDWEQEILDADFGYFYCRAETCNGLDDDCDGAVDEDWGDKGEACDGDDSDLCENGTWTCTPDGSGIECVNETITDIVDICNGLDDDCDGQIDEDYPLTGEACDGDDTDLCENGTWTCTADGLDIECVNETIEDIVELCDGLDNDCDGAIDEDFTLLGDVCDSEDSDFCANGHLICFPQELCRDPNGCEGKTYMCVDDIPANIVEVCNALDDDCDGLMDEGFGSTTCGVGACEVTQENCVNGQIMYCVPGTPLPEACDLVDNDCDGEIDEDLGSTTCGMGICEATVENCVDGQWQTCVPGTPGVEACNLVDDDCDGQVDEDLGSTTCGVGTCEATFENCVDGVWTSCVPGASGVEVCDGLDNDCDGLVDEDLGSMTCGLGACEATVDNCVNGQLQTCVPGDAGFEECNGIDDDCDGLVDEGLGTTTCGVGECQATVDNCVNGQWQDCVPGDPSPEVCDGIDNDCDGLVDEDLGSTTCGVGACEATVDNCVNGVVQTCVPGAGSAEVCDLVDNDCDGLVDEDLGSTTCGLGACEATVENCVNGVVQACVPGVGTAEVCDLLDNDCDGLVDEDLGSTACGLGACEATVENCVNGVVQTCVPGDASPEVCDGIDNDCDGLVDEGLGQTSCGAGECHVIIDVCVNGVVQTCVPGDPSPEVCDGKDNDCDGDVDEGLGTTTCGVGACEATVYNCIDGVPQTCVPGDGSAEVCDGIDNDCDGLVDEDLGTTTCGVGACVATVDNCVGGVVQTCQPGAPVPEDCDLVDNDCDGEIDEDLGSTTCGVGACEVTVENCVNGQWQTCVPGEMTTEVCDLVDNDCDGMVDEDQGSTTCGVGACEATVENCVDGVVQTCVPGDGSAEICDLVDNDCDGLVDEDLGNTTCGIGECVVTTENCIDGQWQDCVPGVPGGENCNLKDDDCDGEIDEGLGNTTCGIGECVATTDNCVNGQWQDCEPGDPTPEICDGLDNDCDMDLDEGLGSTTCGVGACEATVENCVNGVVQTCVPGDASLEICDGIDNDCDGLVDENLGSTTCGLGACEATVENCVDGLSQICQPGAPVPEDCDGIDNDCDGLVDEDLGSTTCGLGACEATVENCVDGQWQTCVPGDAATEICDGIDNDCDGLVDEDLGSTTCGVGACEATVENCVNGVAQTCVPGDATTEICDLVDNDCDGLVDEDLGSTTCGVGACEVTVENCVNGVAQTCVPGDGSAEVCDLVDNDCDGLVDEDLGSTTCGVGACEVTVENCVNGIPLDCEPLDPGYEVCFDGIDNDCDGEVDEDCYCVYDKTFVSDPKTMANGVPAVQTWSEHPFWAAVSAQLPDSLWIWTEYFVSEPEVDTLVTFDRTIRLHDDAVGITGILEMSSDNDSDFWVSVNQVADLDFESVYYNIYTYDITPYLVGGENDLAWDVLNWAQPGGNAYTNPAGLIYEGHLSWMAPIVPEICNGLDDDCDGEIDEDFGTETCGVGACEVTIDVCVDGVLYDCVPGVGGPEVCDGIDNDCDGEIDEDLGTITCGVGACEVTVDACVGGVPQDCVPGMPAAEDCNLIDDDCDGEIDEDLGSTTCGVGVCEATVENCVAGEWQDCVPGVGGPEVCDGLDNDCDGAVDEDLGTTTCGVGACEVTVENCVSGQWQDCVPGTPGLETCDGIDNDCNGEIDEGLGTTTCGVGLCEVTVENCVNGEWQDCVPGGAEEEICDGLDNDCDGEIDEDLGVTTCGLGECEVTVGNCVNGVPQDCVPGAPIDEICFDGLDNNCDGVIDEGCGEGDDCLLPPGCVSLAEAFARGWIVIDTPSSSSATVILHNEGTVSVCLDEHLLLLSDPTQTLTTPIYKADGSAMQIDPGGMITLRYGPWTFPNGVKQNFLNQPPWWCIESGQYATANTVFAFYGEQLPTIPATLIDEVSDLDGDGKEDHVDWAGSFGTQTLYNVWNYLAGHTVLTAGKTASAGNPGEIDVALISHNIGAFAGTGILTDVIPAGYDAVGFTVAPDGSTDNPDGSTTLWWDMALDGYNDIPGMGGTTIFPYMEISYVLLPPLTADGRRIELPRATVDFDDGEADQVSESTLVVAYDVDVDGDGVGSCDDCDDADPLNFPGNVELCDGQDNDCDGDVDEGYALGDICSIGVGACYAEGVTVCAPNGMDTTCDAPIIEPTEEICDGIDNDCDGEIDEGTDGEFYTITQGATSHTVFAYLGSESAQDFYAYFSPKAWASNTGFEKSNRSTFMLYEDPAGDLSLMLMTDKSQDGSGGTLDLQVVGFNEGATLVQKNDSTENHYTDTYDMENGFFTWLWYPCCNDGFVVSKLEIGDDCLTLIPDNTSGFNGWDVISDGGVRMTFPSAIEPITICRTICCTPTGDEICDGVDNDCDGEIDEGFGTVTCGVGACEATVEECVDGVLQGCVPGTPNAEVCDGIDNDCDGAIDEGFGVLTCGVGACYTEIDECIDGALQTCVPGTPNAELCDGIDNDCDGAIDEGFGVLTCGVGACYAEVEECLNGVLQTCVPGTPSAELCDGIDNDCDGDVDEDFPVGDDCSVGGCGAEDYEVWAYSDGDVPTVVYTGDSILFGSTLACNFEHNYDGVEEFEQFFQDSLMVLTESSPIVFYAWGAYDGGDYGAMVDILDDMIVDGAIDDYDLWDVSESTPLDLEPGDLDGVEVVILDAAPDTAASHFVVTEQARQVLADYVADGGKIAGSAYIFVHWTDYTGYVYEEINMDLVDLFGGVTPILGPHYSVAVTTAASPAGAGQDLITLIGAEPWHVGPADPFYHDFWGLEIPTIDTACYAEGSYVCSPDGSGVVCDAVPGLPGPELCGNGIDDDCDCEVDEGFVDVGNFCSAGVGACYVEGEIVCSVDGLTSECNVTAGAPGLEVCDGIDNDCDGEVDEGFGTLTCGVGACYAEIDECIGGVPQTCVPGTPIAEVCDGTDNDCDGAVDEGFGVLTCGVGACYAEIDECIDGVPQTCVPGTPTAEVCDGLDNDCDGAIDDGFGLISCGVGACYAEVEECVNGVPQACVPGTPSEELCDGIDNDCDGAVDEDLGLGDACIIDPCGYGGGVPAVLQPCTQTGVVVCAPDGGVVCETSGCNLATVWQLGVFDFDVNPILGGGEYPTDDMYYDVFDYTVVGAGDPAPAMPGYLSFVPMSEIDPTRPLIDGTAQLNVHFTLDVPLNGAALHFSRYGSEDNYIYLDLDGELLAITTVAEGQNEVYEIPLPFLEAGDHVFSFVYAGGGAENGNYIDAIRLVGENCGDLGPELCGDGIDNNCDCVIDEGFEDLGAFCEDGVGACYAEGELVCSEDLLSLVCGAEAGESVDEICDGIDNDCDGDVDEGFGVLTCGVGACYAEIDECVGGVLQTCVPGTPTAELCDGIDNDCDGVIDDGFGTITCGVGICQVTVEECVAGQLQECIPGAPGVEVCDGLDNDCDGAVDEGLGTVTCGVGACQVTIDLCVGGLLQQCEPGTPTVEICDGIDNDCDGAVDEGLGVLSCGVGACYEEVDACIDGQTQTCVPGTPTEEICGDFIDNDCDGDIDEGCDTDDDCLLPPGCVGLSEAFARGWIIVDTPSSNSATVVLHNIGVAEVCLDENLMMFSDPTQTISTPIIKSGAGQMVIPADGMLTLRYGPWTYANGYYQPYLNQAPWWCFEAGQYATANTVFSFWGEATPPELAYFLNTNTNTDGDGKEDHVDWAGSFGTQTIYNVWNYQANHTVLTAGKTAEATGPGEITVMLVSHNIGAIPGTGMLTDTLPAGWWVTDFSVDPDYWIENGDGSVTMIWDISLPGYQDIPGMGGTTIFPYEEISYSLHPAWSVDGRRLEIPRAEITYQDGCEERTSESSFVVAINVDVDGDGFPACEDCDDGWEDVYPGAEELCDGVDNDCDGEIDEGCPICGNGIIEDGEICDDGENNVDAPNHCQTWCALSLMWPESGQAVVAWEDLPTQGGNDWDYNDWVVEVETEYFFTTEGVVQMALYTDPWARGAAYHHAQGVFIGMGTYNSAGSYVVKTYDEQWGDLTEDPPVFFGPDEDILVEMWDDSWDVLPPNHIGGNYGMYSFDANTESGYGIVLGKKSGIEFEFDTPLDMTPQELAQHVPGTHCENMPYEFFLHVYNTGESISTGDVRMLCVPDLWDWPAEKVAIWDAYDGVMMGSQFPVFTPGWYLDAPVGSVWYP